MGGPPQIYSFVFYPCHTRNFSGNQKSKKNFSSISFLTHFITIGKKKYWFFHLQIDFMAQRIPAFINTEKRPKS